MGTYDYRTVIETLPPEAGIMDPSEYTLKANAYKAYVRIGAEFGPDGQIEPRWIGWEDGRRYVIDKVIDKRREASTKAGGVGIRYLCEIGRSRIRLFYEGNGRWFVERRKPAGE